MRALLYWSLLTALRLSRRCRVPYAGAVFDRLMRTLEHRSAEFAASCPYAGSVLHFPSKSLIGQKAARGEVWDAVIVKVLRGMCFTPTAIVEVGSNIGASIIPVLRAYPGTEAIAIEPSRRYAPYLCKNLAGRRAVTIINGLLVGAADGDQFVLRTNETTGTPSNACYGAVATDEETLTCASLDSLLCDVEKTRGRPFAVDFLKVDTDGFEMAVFQGAIGSIGRYKPLIFTEFSPTSLARLGEPEAFLRLLQEELKCENFLVLSSTGAILGWASSYNDVVALMGARYYVDLFTTPSDSRFFSLLRDITVNPTTP